MSLHQGWYMFCPRKTAPSGKGSLMVFSCSLVVGEKWLVAVGSGWQLVAAGGWGRLAVGSPLGRSLTKKNLVPIRPPCGWAWLCHEE